MNFSRSTRKAFSLATLAVLSAIGVSACVVTDSGYYEEDYYPEDRTVIVKRPAPVVQTVEVYETRPTVIVARPRPYRHHHNYYYSSPRPTRPVIIHQRPQYQSEHKVILNPGRHQQQEVIIKSHNGHRPYNNETHRVSSTNDTEVKQPKKIVIESQG